MSKHKKKDSLGKQSPAERDGGSPQNSRSIPAVPRWNFSKSRLVNHFRAVFSRNNAPFLIVAGLFLLIFMNIFMQLALPDSVKTLLENPLDKQALQMVLRNSTDQQINGDIISLLAENGEEEVAVTVQEEKNKLHEMVRKITLILKDHPNYADGYAYRSVMYFKLHQCEQAEEDIAIALKLDPNRDNFIKLQQDILRCQ
ncbi:MAG: hypothetical protein WC775_04665 [Patescibacteria group bacterium]|jgi:hypothetical protein